MVLVIINPMKTKLAMVIATLKTDTYGKCTISLKTASDCVMGLPFHDFQNYYFIACENGYPALDLQLPW